MVALLAWGQEPARLAGSMAGYAVNIHEGDIVLTTSPGAGLAIGTPEGKRSAFGAVDTPPFILSHMRTKCQTRPARSDV